MNAPNKAVMVSIRPPFAKAVSEGSKTVELRRKFPRVSAGTLLLCYVTKPVGALVGAARIEQIEENSPGALWKSCGGLTGVTRTQFLRYFAGCTRGFGIHLGRYRAIRPLSAAQMAAMLPGFRPPQSFRYIDLAMVKKWLIYGHPTRA